MLLSANAVLSKHYARIKPQSTRYIEMAEETREVRGRLPKELKIAFEIACARLEVTQTAALEEAIRDWLKNKGSPTGDELPGD